MYTACLFCNAPLGANDAIELFPVGRRLAFDERRGRLWVVCTKCRQWNLTPIEERWEAIEDCERQFRATPLRFCTDNVGLARLRDGLELVRIGEALRPEMAAWRYGDQLLHRSARITRGAGIALRAAARAAGAAGARIGLTSRADDSARDPLTWLRLRRVHDRVLDIATDVRGRPVVIRYGDVADARLLRPGPGEPWQMVVRDRDGYATLAGDGGLRTAGKLLAAVNIYGATADEVRAATAKVEDAENADGYFARVFAIAMRTSWGLRLGSGAAAPSAAASESMSERLARYVTTRSFWGRGAIGSEPAAALLDLPVVDRLALEMAAHEDSEGRALRGELAELETAWREAEELAAIADDLLDDGELELFKRRLEERSSAADDAGPRLARG